MPAAPQAQAPPSPDRAPPRAAAGTAEGPVLTVPGHAAHVSTARAFTSAALRACQVDDDGTAGLLVSELVTNALQHSNSAKPGGIITITVIPAPDRVLIEVTDNGGHKEPALRPAGSPDTAESGRGLFLVEQLSAGWGHYRRDGRQVTWFQLPAQAHARQQQEAQVQP